MSKTAKKCKHCKGIGIIFTNKIIGEDKQCHKCEGSGIELFSEIEEQFKEASELDGTISHEGDSNFIEFEEDDYEY